MAPMTHLLASWVIGANATRSQRDCRLVTLAGVLPDLDGAGLVVDAINAACGQKSLYYLHYHHYLLHGIAGGLVLAILLGALGRDKWRVGFLAFSVFHLHLLFDLAGSRGPTPEDLWPIFYYGPFDKDPMWIWAHQWRLDSWINRLFTLGLFAGSWWLALRHGHTFVGVFAPRTDQTVVAVLRKWREDFSRMRGGTASQP